MAIVKGSMYFGANFNIGAEGPIDGRMEAATKADLMTPWVDADGVAVNVYDGMQVTVLADHNVWQLHGTDYTVEANWHKIIGGGSMTIEGSDTVFVETEETSEGITHILTSPEVEIETDSYIIAEADNHNISLSANVITDINEFSAVTENGMLVDANVLREVIEEDEHVTAAALNDLDARVLDNKSRIDNMKFYNDINGEAAMSDGDSFYIDGDDETVFVETMDHGVEISSPKVTAQGDTYVTATTNNHHITLSTDVLSTEDAIKNNTETGHLVDALAVKNFVTNSANLKISAQTPTQANVKEQYVLLDVNNNVLGDTIKIYKDSAFVRGEMGHSGGTINATTGVVTDGTGTTEVLRLIYLDTEGKYTMVEVSLESFVEEAEFKDGLQVSNHEVSVKIDPNTEKYISVSADGIKLSGLTNVLTSIRTYNKISDGTNTYSATTSASTVTVSGDTYVKTVASQDKISLSANVITTIGAFSGLSETGKLVDAKVIRDVIVEDEEVFSAAVNDLNRRILDMDYADAEASANKFVSRVTESDGIINVEHTSFSDVQAGSADHTKAALTVAAGAFTEDGTSFNGSEAKTIHIPTKVSDLTNDSLADVDNYYKFLQTNKNVNVINGIPTDASVVVATISASATFALAAIPTDIREIHVLIHNTASSDITVTLPNSGNYVSTVGTNFVIPANGWGEVNALCVKGTVYLRAA